MQTSVTRYGDRGGYGCYYSMSYHMMMHYRDVTWASWRLKSQATPMFAQQIVQSLIEENQVLHYWSLMGVGWGGWGNAPVAFLAFCEGKSSVTLHKGSVMRITFPRHDVSTHFPWKKCTQSCLVFIFCDYIINSQCDNALFNISSANFNIMMTSSNGIIFRVTCPLWGKPSVTGGFPTQRPVTRSFDVFCDLCK